MTNYCFCFFRMLLVVIICIPWLNLVHLNLSGIVGILLMNVIIPTRHVNLLHEMISSILYRPTQFPLPFTPLLLPCYYKIIFLLALKFSSNFLVAILLVEKCSSLHVAFIFSDTLSKCRTLGPHHVAHHLAMSRHRFLVSVINVEKLVTGFVLLRFCS